MVEPPSILCNTKSMFRFISGTTGSGKTDLALVLARDFHLNLVNADAFQFYREISILSNRHTESNGSGSVPSIYFGFRSIVNPISAGDFAKLSLSVENDSSIWVGGGLYLGAAIYGLDEDRRRGTPFQGPPRQLYRGLIINPDREELYARLDKRVDQMIEAGALEEVRRIKELIDAGSVPESNPVLKAIGLRELLEVAAGQMEFNKAVEDWKRNTRRLAKRQWTWLRKFWPPSESIRWITNIDNISEAAEHLRLFEARASQVVPPSLRIVAS